MLIDHLSEKNKAAALVLVLRLTTKCSCPKPAGFYLTALVTKILLLQQCQEARLKPFCTQDTALREEYKKPEKERGEANYHLVKQRGKENKAGQQSH